MVPVSIPWSSDQSQSFRSPLLGQFSNAAKFHFVKISPTRQALRLSNHGLSLISFISSNLDALELKNIVFCDILAIFFSNTSRFGLALITFPRTVTCCYVLVGCTNMGREFAKKQARVFKFLGYICFVNWYPQTSTISVGIQTNTTSSDYSAVGVTTYYSFPNVTNLTSWLEKSKTVGKIAAYIASISHI